MADFREQRYAIKFCVKLGKSSTDTYSDLKKAFGNDAMSERTCFRWHRDFKNGRESCELEGGPGAPVSALTEETINTAGVMIHTDPHLTIRRLAILAILKQLMKDHIPKKRPDLVGRWKLHHDNARPHVANTVLQFLAKKEVETVPHPPYSPDLAPNDFFLYPQAKMELKGRRFQTTIAAIKALEAILKVLAKEGFEHVFKEWQRRWDKCVALNGDYLEGDTSVKL